MSKKKTLTMTVTFPSQLGLKDQVIDNPMEVPQNGDVIVTEKGNFQVTRKIWNFDEMTVSVYVG